MTCPTCNNARTCGCDIAWGSCIGCHAPNRRPAPGCVYCPFCIDECDENLGCLAHNLEIGAALCRAFWLGQCYEEPFPDSAGDWWPGCQRPVP